jgi:hypothetical protein
MQKFGFASEHHWGILLEMQKLRVDLGIDDILAFGGLLQVQLEYLLVLRCLILRLDHEHIEKTLGKLGPPQCTSGKLSN